MQRPQGSGGGPGLGLKITRAVGGVRRRLGRSAGRGGAPERPCKHADVGIDGVPICAAVCTTDAALYKWLAAEYCRVWRTIALQRIDLSGCCVREVISSGTRMALKILVSAVRFRPRPPKFKPQPLSVGVFSYVLPPDPANMRGTLSRFADFDRPAASLPLATWRSLRAIPLSFLTSSKLPEVRRSHAFGLCKSTACALIDQAVVFLASVSNQ